MSLNITTTPTISGGILYGDVPIDLLLDDYSVPYGLGDDELDLHPNWTVSDGGTLFSDAIGDEGLSPRHTENPEYTSSNRSQTVTIKGRRVTWMGDGLSTTEPQFGWSSFDAEIGTPDGVFGNLLKPAGSSTWNAEAVGRSSGGAHETFYQFTTSEINKEKAGGLCTNASQKDPTATNYTFTVTSADATSGATYTNNGKTFTVSSTIDDGTTLVMTGTGVPLTSGTLTKVTGTGDATITFSSVIIPLQFTWHLDATGNAQARNLGVAISGGLVTYVANDVFQTHMIGTTVYYLKNNVVIATLTGQTVGNYYPIASIKSVGGTIKESVQFTDALTPAKQGTLTFDLLGVFPIEPSYAVELNRDNRTLASVAEDGTAVFRVKGGIKKTINLQFNGRPPSDFNTIADFWDWHQKHLAFYFRDRSIDDGTARGYVMYHDSGLKTIVNGPQDITMSVVVREV